MKNRILLKRWVLRLLAVLGYMMLLPLFRWFRRKSGRERFRILNYHSVHATRPHATNVTPEAFGAQIAFVAKKSRVMGLPQIMKALVEGRALPTHAVAITLDDGYADNLRVALPALAEHRIAATIFLTVRYINTSMKLPHDALCSMEEARLLTWSEVLTLRDNGVTIGSHGLTHSRLSDLGRETLRNEVFESKSQIERELREQVRFFSFPYGRRDDYTSAAVEEVKKAGYEACVTAMYGWNSNHTDPFQLRRIGIDSSDTLFTIGAKLNGGLDLLLLMEWRPIRWLVHFLNTRLGGAKGHADPTAHG